MHQCFGRDAPRFSRNDVDRLRSRLVHFAGFALTCLCLPEERATVDLIDRRFQAVHLPFSFCFFPIPFQFCARSTRQHPVIRTIPTVIFGVLQMAEEKETPFCFMLSCVTRHELGSLPLLETPN